MRSTAQKLSSLVLILVAMGLIVSCGNSLRQQLLEQNPDWPQKYVKAIKQGNISKGMTRDMVKAAWGHPKKNSEASGPSYSDKWVYETADQTSYSATYVYFDNEGKVVKVDTPD